MINQGAHMQTEPAQGGENEPSIWTGARMADAAYEEVRRVGLEQAEEIARLRTALGMAVELVDGTVSSGYWEPGTRDAIRIEFCRAALYIGRRGAPGYRSVVVRTGIDDITLVVPTSFADELHEDQVVTIAIEAPRASARSSKEGT